RGPRLSERLGSPNHCSTRARPKTPARAQASNTTSCRVVARQGRPRHRSGGRAAAPRLRTQRRTKISRSASVTRPRFCSQIARSARIASRAALASMATSSSSGSRPNTHAATRTVLCRIRFVPRVQRTQAVYQGSCDAGDIRFGSAKGSAGPRGLRRELRKQICADTRYVLLGFPDDAKCFLVGPIDLVDEQHWWWTVARDRLEERALYEKALAVDPFAGVARVAFALGQADLEDLPRVVPVVDGGRDVETLIALEADQPPAER